MNEFNLESFLNDLPSNYSSLKFVGEGKFRKVYSLNNKAVKILKPFVLRDFLLFQVRSNLIQRTKHRYSIDDFNSYEFEMYQDLMSKIPSDYKKYFARIDGVGRFREFFVSVGDLVLDFDGKISPSFERFGKIERDNIFWYKLQNLHDVLEESEIYFGDLSSRNICIKTEINPLDNLPILSPVIVDFKRIGEHTYKNRSIFGANRFVKKRMNKNFDNLFDEYSTL
jgi:hypothetical protein